MELVVYDFTHLKALYLDAEGRLSLLDSVRQELGLVEGDRFILTVLETGVIQLTSLRQQVHSLRRILKNPIPEKSIVDELIQERRNYV